MQFKPFLSSTRFIDYYSQTNRKFSLVYALLPLASSLMRFRFNTTLRLIRFARISKIEEEVTVGRVYSSPIELLVVCGPQDFPILPLCIKSTLRFSVNPVSRVMIIVRENDVELARKQILNINGPRNTQIEIVSENDFIPPGARLRLRQKFGTRYGWILQQVIKVHYVSQSQAKAVLVIDADTVLLQPLNGIDLNGNQHLSYSSEMQKTYREFLKKIQVPIKRPFFSAVTHHMIIQPAIMRELLFICEMQDLDKFTEKLSKFNSKSVVSPISVDYELYGQYLRARYSNKINYCHFSNQSKHRSSEAFQEVEEILNGNKISNFRSFSFHGYL